MESHIENYHKKGGNDRSINYENLVRDIARELKSSFGFEIDSKADLEKVLKQIRESIPFENNKKASSNPNIVKECCQRIAKIFNNNFGPNFIDTNLDAKNLCKEVGQKIYSLTVHLNSEASEVVHNLNIVIKNLGAVILGLEKNFEQLNVKGDGANFHKFAIKELKKLAENLEIMNGYESEIHKYKQLKKYFEKMEGINENSLANIFGITYYFGEMSAKLKDLIKKVNMSMEDVKKITNSSDPAEALASNIYKQLNKITKSEMSDYLESYRQIKEIIGNKQFQMHIIKGSGQSKMIEKTELEQIALVDLFNEQFIATMRIFNNSILEFMKKIGEGKIKISKEYEDFLLSMEELPQIKTVGEYYNLSGVRRNDLEAENFRDSYLQKLKKIREVLAHIMHKDENLKKMHKCVEELIFYIEDFGERFRKGVGIMGESKIFGKGILDKTIEGLNKGSNMIISGLKNIAGKVGQTVQKAKQGLDKVENAVLGGIDTREKVRELTSRVKSSNFAKVIYNFNKMKNELANELRKAEILESFDLMSKNFDDLYKDYDTLNAKSIAFYKDLVANKINNSKYVVSKGQQDIIFNLGYNRTSYYKSNGDLENSGLDKDKYYIIDTSIKRLGNKGGISPSLVVDTPYDSEHEATLKMQELKPEKKKYLSWIDLIDTAEALDIFYKSFTEFLIKNPLDIKKILLNINEDLILMKGVDVSDLAAFMNDKGLVENTPTGKKKNYKAVIGPEIYEEREKFFTQSKTVHNIISIFQKIATNLVGENFPKPPSNILESLVNFAKYNEIIINHSRFDGNNYQAKDFVGEIKLQDLYSDIIRSMIGFVLLCFNTYSVFYKSPNSMVLKPMRTIFGGGENSNINPDAIEFYIRIPLLVKFYHNVFKNDKKEKYGIYFKTASPLSRIFEIIGKSDITVFPESDIKILIEECNNLYSNNKSIKETCAEIIKEINHRLAWDYFDKEKVLFESKEIIESDISNILSNQGDKLRPSSFKSNVNIFSEASENLILKYNKYGIENFYKEIKSQIEKNVGDKYKDLKLTEYIESKKIEIKNSENKLSVISNMINEFNNGYLNKENITALGNYEFIIAPVQSLLWTGNTMVFMIQGLIETLARFEPNNKSLYELIDESEISTVFNETLSQMIKKMKANKVENCYKFEIDTSTFEKKYGLTDDDKKNKFWTFVKEFLGKYQSDLVKVMVKYDELKNENDEESLLKALKEYYPQIGDLLQKIKGSSETTVKFKKSEIFDLIDTNSFVKNKKQNRINMINAKQVSEDTKNADRYVDAIRANLILYFYDSFKQFKGNFEDWKKDFVKNEEDTLIIKDSYQYEKSNKSMGVAKLFNYSDDILKFNFDSVVNWESDDDGIEKTLPNEKADVQLLYNLMIGNTDKVKNLDDFFSIAARDLSCSYDIFVGGGQDQPPLEAPKTSEIDKKKIEIENKETFQAALDKIDTEYTKDTTKTGTNVKLDDFRTNFIKEFNTGKDEGQKYKNDSKTYIDNDIISYKTKLYEEHRKINQETTDGFGTLVTGTTAWNNALSTKRPATLTDNAGLLIELIDILNKFPHKLAYLILLHEKTTNITLKNICEKDIASEKKILESIVTNKGIKRKLTTKIEDTDEYVLLNKIISAFCDIPLGALGVDQFYDNYFFLQKTPEIIQNVFKKYKDIQGNINITLDINLFGQKIVYQTNVIRSLTFDGEFKESDLKENFLDKVKTFDTTLLPFDDLNFILYGPKDENTLTGYVLKDLSPSYTENNFQIECTFTPTTNITELVKEFLEKDALKKSFLEVQNIDNTVDTIQKYDTYITTEFGKGLISLSQKLTNINNAINAGWTADTNTNTGNFGKFSLHVAKNLGNDINILVQRLVIEGYIMEITAKKTIEIKEHGHNFSAEFGCSPSTDNNDLLVIDTKILEKIIKKEEINVVQIFEDQQKILVKIMKNEEKLLYNTLKQVPEYSIFEEESFMKKYTRTQKKDSYINSYYNFLTNPENAKLFKHDENFDSDILCKLLIEIYDDSEKTTNKDILKTGLAGISELQKNSSLMSAMYMKAGLEKVVSKEQFDEFLQLSREKHIDVRKAKFTGELYNINDWTKFLYNNHIVPVEAFDDLKMLATFNSPVLVIFAETYDINTHKKDFVSEKFDKLKDIIRKDDHVKIKIIFKIDEKEHKFLLILKKLPEFIYPKFDPTADINIIREIYGIYYSALLMKVSQKYQPQLPYFNELNQTYNNFVNITNCTDNLLQIRLFLTTLQAMSELLEEEILEQSTNIKGTTAIPTTGLTSKIQQETTSIYKDTFQDKESEVLRFFGGVSVGSTFEKNIADLFYIYNMKDFKDDSHETAPSGSSLDDEQKKKNQRIDDSKKYYEILIDPKKPINSFNFEDFFEQLYKFHSKLTKVELVKNNKNQLSFKVDFNELENTYKKLIKHLQENSKNLPDNIFDVLNNNLNVQYNVLFGEHYLENSIEAVRKAFDEKYGSNENGTFQISYYGNENSYTTGEKTDSEKMYGVIGTHSKHNIMFMNYETKVETHLAVAEKFKDKIENYVCCLKTKLADELKSELTNLINNYFKKSKALKTSPSAIENEFYEIYSDFKTVFEKEFSDDITNVKSDFIDTSIFKTIVQSLDQKTSGKLTYVISTIDELNPLIKERMKETIYDHIWRFENLSERCKYFKSLMSITEKNNDYRYLQKIESISLEFTAALHKIANDLVLNPILGCFSQKKYCLPSTSLLLLTTELDNPFNDGRKILSASRPIFLDKIEKHHLSGVMEVLKLYNENAGFNKISESNLVEIMNEYVKILRNGNKMARSRKNYQKCHFYINHKFKDQKAGFLINSFKPFESASGKYDGTATVNETPYLFYIERKITETKADTTPPTYTYDKTQELKSAANNKFKFLSNQRNKKSQTGLRLLPLIYQSDLNKTIILATETNLAEITYKVAHFLRVKRQDSKILIRNIQDLNISPINLSVLYRSQIFAFVHLYSQMCEDLGFFHENSGNIYFDNNANPSLIKFYTKDGNKILMDSFKNKILETLKDNKKEVMPFLSELR